jgi:hypothetical protein
MKKSELTRKRQGRRMAKILVFIFTGGRRSFRKGNENEVVRPEVVACVRQSKPTKMLFPSTQHCR